jgi:SAM-dependent methyltransferase
VGDSRGDPGPFARAVRWKAYIGELLRDQVRGDVLEVLGGLGMVRAAFRESPVKSWMTVVDTQDAAEPHSFDTVLYVDVLEHLDDDGAELQRAALLLRAGGRVVVVAPAFPGAMSAFDHAVGHRRRYTPQTLAALAPPGLQCRILGYADSLGLLLNLGNKLLLRTGRPREGQVQFWDRFVIPLSRQADRVLRKRFGRSVLAVFAGAAVSPGNATA